MGEIQSTLIRTKTRDRLHGGKIRGPRSIGGRP